MQELRDLMIFVAVARAGSFKAAAIDLRMQTSTVSRRIAALEQQLGTRLLERTTRSVALTNAGRHLRSRAERLVDKTMALTRDVEQSVQNAAGFVRIAAPVEFSEVCLAPVVADFIARYPDITVEVEAGPHNVDLIAERFDVAIRYGTVCTGALRARRLCTTPIGLFASPDYLEAYGRPHCPQDLALHTCIFSTGTAAAEDFTFSDGGQRVTVRLGAQLTVNSRLLARSMCVAGAGIAPIAEFLAQAPLEAGRLERILHEWRIDPHVLNIVTPAAEASPATRLFIRMVVERLGDAVAVDTCFDDASR